MLLEVPWRLPAVCGTVEWDVRNVQRRDKWAAGFRISGVRFRVLCQKFGIRKCISFVIQRNQLLSGARISQFRLERVNKA